MSNPGVTDRQVERLIDGELDQSEQRLLLETLETQPESWRTVALGFVETQLMRSEIIAWNPGTATAKPVPGVAKPAAGPGRLSQLMTVAAAAVAAFAIGIAARHWWPAPGSESQGRPLANTVQQRPVDKPVLQVQGGSAATSKDALRRVNLPIVPAERVDPRALYRTPTVTPELRAALQRMGHVVHEERRFYCIELDDGRCVLVPVNEIQVRYVGNKVIQ